MMMSNRSASPMLANSLAANGGASNRSEMVYSPFAPVRDAIAGLEL